MKRIFLKTAVRHLTRNTVHSLLNIGGLSLGLTCSLLILLWVQHETSVDNNLANGPRLYKVYEREYYKDHVDGNYDMPGLLAGEIKKKIPEVEDAIIIDEDVDELKNFQVGDKIFRIMGTAAGTGLFTMFGYPLLEGSPTSALAGMKGIALSKKAAVQVFGSVHSAMGKTMRWDDDRDLVVTAVYDDLPATASRRFDYVVSWDTWMDRFPSNRSWQNSAPLCYVLLKANTSAAVAEKKLAHFLDTYNKPSDAFHVELGLQPFGEVYLHNQFKDGKIAGGRIEYVRLFSFVAALILLIACINFMNLTTARSIKRAREVGVRKTIGASRFTLIAQFIGESLLITTLSAMLALIGILVLLPLFNTLTHLHLALPFDQAGFWLRLGSITLITGLIAGSYPALYLSGFKPVKVLKGVIRPGAGVVNIRKGLVVFQFVLSIVFITGTLIISRQIDFIQNRNLGYDRGNLLYVPLEGTLGKKFDVFKIEALKRPGIANVARMPDNPTTFDNWTNGVDWEGRDPNTLVSFAAPAVSWDFLQTMKLQLVAGRDFSRQYASDWQDAFIINETTARIIGYTSPVGRSLTMWGRKGTIIGVVKDFHFRSLHEPIKPMIIRMGNWGGTMLVRTQPGKTKEALANLEDLAHQMNPRFAFSYSFSDEAYKNLYQSEQLVGKLSRIFAMLAIFISCLGLLGLVMFTTEQRFKEIGIRKVLGASGLSILKLLTIDFLKLIVVAIAIAIPIAWWSMNSWLNDYAYRAPIDGWVFVLTGGLAFGIAMLTMSFHAIKAAQENPVKSIRME